MSRIHSFNEDVNIISFHTIDQHAQKVPMSNMYTEDNLIEYLAKPIDKEDKNWKIYLARAFIVFLSEINITRRSKTFRVSAAMQKIIYDNSTDAFHSLCCNAGMEVEIIRGRAKGSNYQPGKSDTDSLQQSKWCAFKSDDTWHLVHPQWATVSLYGFSYSGTVLEGDGVPSMQPCFQNQGQIINAFNDFWFCTKPEIFIHHCFPDEDEWQLLPMPHKSVDDFLILPYLQQGYFEASLKLLSEFSCTLGTSNGVCIVSFAADKMAAKNLEFSYNLILLEGDRSKVKSSDLCQLVMFVPSEDMYSFKISLPVEGIYSFEIMVIADDIVTNASCADFRIECNEACKNCRKVPLSVGIEGFGFGHEAKHVGLKNPSQKMPVVVLKSPEEQVGSDCEDEVMDFHIDSDRVNEVEFSSDIVGEVDRKSVHSEAYVDGKKGKLVVKAWSSKKGDFTLAIKAREKNSEAEFKTVMNYMLTTDGAEKDLYCKHKKVVKQRKRDILREEKLADKTKIKTELIKKIETLKTTF